MQTPKLSKEVVERIIFDPEFVVVLDYIEAHFANSTDIQAIDVSNSSSTVHAEVIARQHIDRDLKSLRESFDMLKQHYNRKKVTYE